MSNPDNNRPRRSNYFAIRMGARVGLIALLVVGGVIFHHRGHGYTAIRTFYFVAIAGLLIWRISYRQRRVKNYRDRGPGPMS